jgi:predicted acylesterase/phospholipase RssA
MGAFIGGQLAMDRDVAAIDACCYEEWVRRNPINDYTLPRAGLIRGNKARAMVERVFGDARAEDLSRSFYCASVNLRRSGLIISREGLMFEIVGASMSLPLIAPPVRSADALLIDGSLLDNLPLEPMSAAGEGPVVAIDIKGGEGRPGEPGARDPREHRRRLPSLPETLGRIALLSSANTDDAAQRYADLTIPIRVSGVGLLEFHQIDHAREPGAVRHWRHSRTHPAG